MEAAELRDQHYQHDLSSGAGEWALHSKYPGLVRVSGERWVPFDEPDNRKYVVLENTNSGGRSGGIEGEWHLSFQTASEPLSYREASQRLDALRKADDDDPYAHEVRDNAWIKVVWAIRDVRDQLDRAVRPSAVKEEIVV